MTPRQAATCNHERRHGTTVCLYCRLEEREASRVQRKHTALRLSGYLGGAAIVGVALFAAIAAMRNGDASGDAVAAPAIREAAPAPQDQPAPAATPAGSTPVAAAFIVPEGRTELRNGVHADRSGDTVTVHFDTPATRTRRADKFERVVRETLPGVLGVAGDSALAAFAPGAFVDRTALLSGGSIRIPLADGRAMRLTPGTRPGEDGPLVVTYRVVPELTVPRS